MTLCNTKDCENEIVYRKTGLCRTHRMRAYEKERRVERTEYHRKYRIKLRDTVFSHYGGVCVCCAEPNYAFLSIDHVNNDGNLDQWPSGHKRTGHGLYSKIIADGFPKTFQLLCMNCNWGKRASGICPHKTLVV